MKVSKNELEIIIEKLNECLVIMEEKEVDYINTSCNTYGLSNNFISFGYNGYLDLGGDFYEMIESDDE